MFSPEYTGKRIVGSLNNHAISHPLPELCLGGPKLLAVTANHERGLLSLLLLVLLDHLTGPHTYTSALAYPSVAVKEGPEAATHKTP